MKANVCIFLILSAACRREEAPPAAPEAAPVAGTAAGAAAAGTFVVVELQIHLPVDEKQAVVGVDVGNLQPILEKSLGQMPQVRSLGPSAATPAAEKVGIGLEINWQRLDMQGKPLDIAEAATDSTLLLAVHAFGEQRPKKGQREVAESKVDAQLPMPAKEFVDFAGFIRPRLQKATQTAVANVLGQLWARGQDDKAIVKLLDDAETWRQAAAAREVGERKLQASRVKVEKLARSSRSELAAVAVAALGRLANPSSLAVLQKALDSSHLEVADAALVALLDLNTPEALQRVSDAAENHPNAFVKMRAGSLLQQHQP